MNLHGYLAKSFIMYESNEALDFANTFFMMMNYYSLEASMEIAKERGKTFVGFEKSAYADGTYFNNYINRDYMPKTAKVTELFEGIHIPTVEDWLELKAKIKEHGIYHAYRLAIAPNQSTSYIMNATASVMPIVDIIEVREYGDSTTYYPMPYLTNDNYFYFKSAYDMDQFKVLKLISVIQRHIDQGVSTILHTNSKDSTRDLSRYYIYAHKLGLKSLYYTRTRKSTIDECVSCSA
jgi:ribonucleoside-diphosphate reductase alpha chain